MFRIHLARFFVLTATMFIAGCSTCGSGCERPGLLTRFRAAMNPPQAVPISSGDCCDQGAVGPMLPPTFAVPGSTLPPPQSTIPRIDENGKQMPWDPKMSRPGLKTGNEVRVIKEGT